MPLTGGVRGSFGDGARVEPVRGGPGPADQATGRPPRRTCRCRGRGRASTAARSAAVRQAVSRTSRVARHSLSCPDCERGEGVRHLGHEGLGQAQEPAALGGGFAPGQGDLRADPGPELLRGDPGGGLGAALEQASKDTASRACSAAEADFSSSSTRIRSMIPGSVRGRADRGHHADQVLDGRRRSDRPGDRIAPGATESSVAVSCRNHFRPLIAVHESSLLRGSDIYRRARASGQAAAVGGRRLRGRTCAAGNEDFSATVPGFGLPPALPCGSAAIRACRSARADFTSSSSRI